MYRKLALLLCVIFLVTAMVPMSSMTLTAKAAKIAPKPITLTWYLPFSWWYGKWDTDIARYITQQTGVAVKFQLPTGDGNEKLNMMMAANNLPDIVSAEWWMPPATKLKEGNFVMDLDQLMKKAGTAKIARNIGSAVLNRWRYKGTLYSIPTWYFNLDKLKKGDYPGIGGMFVRKDIYDAIGRPNMSTQAGFINACKAALAKYPTVNGKLLVPVLAAELNGSNWTNVSDLLSQYFNCFFLVDSDIKAGKATRQTANQKDMYMFLNKLVRNNLLMKENLVEKMPQILEKAANGQAFAFWDNLAGQTLAAADKWAAANNTEYIAIEPVRNSFGDTPREQTAAGGGFGWFENFISKRCKDPVTAMKFFEYLSMPDTQNVLKYGIPGRDFTMGSGKVRLSAAMLAAFRNNETKVLQKVGAGAHNMIYDGSDTNRSVMPEKESASYIQRTKLASKYTIDDRALINAQVAANTPEAVISAKLGDLWGNTLAKLVLARSNEEFNAVWDDYIKKASEMGYDKVYQANVKNYQDFSKKLFGK